MSGVTNEEILAFFKVMDRYNLPYLTKPRSQECIDNLVCVYNSSTKEYYTIDKSTKLSENERVVSPNEIFSNISKDIDVLRNDSDEFIKE